MERRISNHIELISSSTGLPLAYVVRAAEDPRETTFVTPDEANLQVGFVVYPAGGEIARHSHRPIERTILGTSEVLVVRMGRCELDIYDEAQTLVTTRELREGDVMVMVGGGHGFRLTEDTVLLEVKQGPYTGPDEKERF
jgi:quercetin dioxygenase-like cupin family protein